MPTPPFRAGIEEHNGSCHPRDLFSIVAILPWQPQPSPPQPPEGTLPHHHYSLAATIVNAFSMYQCSLGAVPSSMETAQRLVGTCFEFLAYGGIKSVVLNLPNAATLQYSSSCCGDSQPQNYFIATSQLQPRHCYESQRVLSALSDGLRQLCYRFSTYGLRPLGCIYLKMSL